MKSKYPSIDQVKNESDVEQKLIFPFLTNANPIGLGIDSANILTKTKIRSLVIGKGGSKKNYFPDYCIVSTGVPLLIIEAKSPNEDLEEAKIESRLYCSELNACYPPQINPCQYFIVSNGKITEGYEWDSNQALFSFSISEMTAVNTEFSKALDLFSDKNISRLEKEILNRISPSKKYFKPLLLLGGRAVRNEELEPNSFGTSLALELRNIFSPETEQERKNIVQNAYVKSKRRLRHVNPIDKIIRAAQPASITHSTEIQDTDNPKELLAVLKDKVKVKKHVLLFIGSVGSGKSTFIEYLRDVALPDDLKKNLVWMILDLNNAPLSKDLIYNWIANQIVESLILSHPEYDFEEKEILEKVFSLELKKVKKGEAAYFQKGSEQYNILLSKEMTRLKTDPSLFANGLLRFLCAEKGKLPIVVLDNCDKRKRDDQLLMFDVAKWVQNQFSSVVFLPIRDTTYDNHRHEPPLDTVVKDLSFRIEPPPFLEILQKRIDYSLRQLNSNKDERPIKFALSNNMIVEYPNTEKAAYLACILKSIYDDESQFRQIITGIAGRDIRKGLEIFLDVCKSGHIGSSEIVKIKNMRGNYALPKHLILRVLLRGNRKYYDGTVSFVKNMFDSNPDDSLPNPFTRIHILKVLKSKFREKGPSGVTGYHSVESIEKELVPFGHSKQRISFEIEDLVKSNCILTESQDIENFKRDELVSISPAGHIHLDLINIIDYLSTCAEDFWFDNEVASKNVLNLMTGSIGTGHYSLDSKILCAEWLLMQIKSYSGIVASNPKKYSNLGSSIDFYNIDEVDNSISRAKDHLNGEQKEYLDQISQYPLGTIVDGTVSSIQEYGLFFEFGLARGFCHISKIPYSLLDGGIDSHIETGDLLKLTIDGYNTDHKRFNVNLAEK